jgi:hypothetical protein
MEKTHLHSMPLLSHHGFTNHHLHSIIYPHREVTHRFSLQTYLFIQNVGEKLLVIMNNIVTKMIEWFFAYALFVTKRYKKTPTLTTHEHRDIGKSCII